MLTPWEACWTLLGVTGAVWSARQLVRPKIWDERWYLVTTIVAFLSVMCVLIAFRNGG